MGQGRNGTGTHYGTGIQGDWEIMELGHRETGTSWHWYTGRLGRHGTGTQGNWDVMTLVHRETGTTWHWYTGRLGRH